MKKILLLVAVILMASCSTSDDSDNNNGGLIREVKKFLFDALDTTTTYEYNSSGNISKITSVSNSETVITTFNYDDNGRMTGFVEETSDVFGDETVETDVFGYTGDLVTSICIELETITNENIPDYADKIEYFYNANGFAERIDHFWGEDSEFSDCDDITDLQFSEFLEYDGNGNMIYYLNDNDGFFGPNYYDYTYDSNPHPLSNVQPEEFNKLYGFSTRNNIASAVEYNANTDEQSATISFEYEYNDNGFPTRLTRVYDAGGFSQTQTFEYTYY